MSDFARHQPDTLLSLHEVAQMARVDLLVVTDAVRDRKLVASQVRGDWRSRSPTCAAGSPAADPVATYTSADSPGASRR